MFLTNGHNFMWCVFILCNTVHPNVHECKSTLSIGSKKQTWMNIDLKFRWWSLGGKKNHSVTILFEGSISSFSLNTQACNCMSILWFWGVKLQYFHHVSLRPSAKEDRCLLFSHLFYQGIHFAIFASQVFISSLMCKTHGTNLIVAYRGQESIHPLNLISRFTHTL